MAISLKHLFQSAKTDGPDNTIVQPSDWNDEHVLTLDQGKIVGRAAGAGTGAAQELPVSVATDGSTIISGSSSNAMLRITQTGAGNALVVEDSANPDATPFVVQADGKIVTGYTNSLTLGGAIYRSYALGSGSDYPAAFGYTGNSALGAITQFAKNRSTDWSTNTIVANGDVIGGLNFAAADGSSFVNAAQIAAIVDGTPGTNDMPGRLVFSTTADGASSPTERMRITATGDITMSGTGAVKLHSGTTAQRPASPSAGAIRFNTSLTSFEGYNGTAWTAVGGAATGGGSDQIFIQNDQTVTQDYTIATGKNAGTFGPVTINSGVTVTVPSGSVWTVV